MRPARGLAIASVWLIQSYALAGGLYIPNSLNTGRDAEILEFDSATGAFTATLVGNMSSGQINGMTIGPDGLIYAAYWDGQANANGRIDRFDLNGNFLDTFVPAGTGNLSTPLGLTFGPDGNLYVANAPSGIKKYNGVTGQFISDFTNGPFNPQDLAFGPDGNLYVTSGFTDTVVRYSGTSGAFIDNFISGPAIDAPIGIAFGPNGDLFVASMGTNSVARYSLNGSLVRNVIDHLAGNTVLDVIFGPDGNLYVFVRYAGNVEAPAGIIRFTADTNAFIDVFIPWHPTEIRFNTGMAFVDPLCARWGAIGRSASCFSPSWLPLPDQDNDEVADSVDNCINVSNFQQLDTDADGYGNICDGDINNSGLTTTADFNLLRSCLNREASSSSTCAAADLNGSGLVTTADYNLLRSLLNKAPGPSGLHP